MNRGTAMALWALATVLLAGATAYVVSQTVPPPVASAEPESADFHQWMHDRLEITAEQHEALAPYESAFEADRERLRVEITEAGRELAKAVRGGRRESPEIEAALTRLNAAQAELQRVTLDHFFAMKAHLEPDQAEKLLQWTHDSIVSE